MKNTSDEFKQVAVDDDDDGDVVMNIAVNVDINANNEKDAHIGGDSTDQIKAALKEIGVSVERAYHLL